MIADLFRIAFVGWSIFPSHKGTGILLEGTQAGLFTKIWELFLPMMRRFTAALFQQSRLVLMLTAERQVVMSIAPITITNELGRR